MNSTYGLASLIDTPKPKTYRRQPPARTATCDICGATFETRQPRQKRCSWECMEQYQRLRRTEYRTRERSGA